jgi:hypothetical protein
VVFDWFILYRYVHTTWCLNGGDTTGCLYSVILIFDIETIGHVCTFVPSKLVVKSCDGETSDDNQVRLDSRLDVQKRHKALAVCPSTLGRKKVTSTRVLTNWMRLWESRNAKSIFRHNCWFRLDVGGIVVCIYPQPQVDKYCTVSYVEFLYGKLPYRILYFAGWPARGSFLGLCISRWFYRLQVFPRFVVEGVERRN